MKQISPKEMRVKTWRGLRQITEFDEVEIHEMTDGPDGDLCQQADRPEWGVLAYSVFLHRAEGGIECVQDFRFLHYVAGARESAKQEAEMLGEQLRDMLRAAGVLRSFQAAAEDSSADLRRQADADRYRWLRDHGFRYADIDLGSGLEGENTVDVKFRLSIPEPVGMSYEQDEWKLKDFDAAIDAARAKPQR